MKLRVPICWLAALHFVVIGAEFFAPYEHTSQLRREPFVPPTKLHFIHPHGAVAWRPFICRSMPDPAAFGSYVEDCSQIFPIRLFVSGDAYRMAGFIPWNRRLFGVEQPATIHLMGTDTYGRDILSRFLHGGRISLFAGLFACGIAMGLGVLLGTIAGFYGGWKDDAITGLSEVFLSLPWLFLLLAVRASLPLQMPPYQSFVLICGLVGVVGWARPARLVRGVVLSAKERGYVQAARGFSATDLHVLLWHILPETTSVVRTHAALLIPRYILAEVTLSFFGLGVSEPMASWGALLAAMHYSALQSHWWIVLPVLPLSATFSAYMLLARANRSDVDDVSP